MNEQLLSLLCCPCCRGDLELRKTKVLAHARAGDHDREVFEGILTCSKCANEYPVLDSIPRLCKNLWETEIRALEQFKKAGDTVTEPRVESARDDVYVRIEQLVRQRFDLPDDASEYVRRRMENDVHFRVRACEKQEKYVSTLRLYCHDKIQSVLDVGGGQGGLTKCLNDLLNPSMSIMLDYDLSWLEVARLRNPTTQVVRGDAARLPFKRNSIDLVISQSMLEHVEEHDRALREMCEVAREVFFLCFGPNKFSLYDIGHLDAPVALFPSSVGEYVAILWHGIRRTGRSSDSIRAELAKTFYISTTHVKRILKEYGRVFNVFTDFCLFSIKSDYSYRMEKLKRCLAAHPTVAKCFFDVLALLRIEPQCYYIVQKGANDSQRADCQTLVRGRP